MADLGPVLIAFLLNLFGYSLFRKPEPPPDNVHAPLLSSLLFAFGVFILIWDTRLYPRHSRPLHWFLNYMYQYVVSTFLLEFALNDIWFPLEVGALQFLPAVGDFLNDIAKNLNLGCICSISAYFHRPEALFIWSYIISSTFLCCVLHSSRIMDVRILLRCGVSVFIKDVLKNLKHIRNKLLADCVATNREYGCD